MVFVSVFSDFGPTSGMDLPTGVLSTELSLNFVSHSVHLLSECLDKFSLVKGGDGPDLFTILSCVPSVSRLCPKDCTEKHVPFPLDLQLLTLRGSVHFLSHSTSKD